MLLIRFHLKMMQLPHRFVLDPQLAQIMKAFVFGIDDSACRRVMIWLRSLQPEFRKIR